MQSSRSFWGLIVGAVTAAAMATSCCIAPLLFLLFGISASSLSFLNIFAPYQIHLSALSVLVVLYLWINYFVKIKSRMDCQGSLCRNYLIYLSIGTIFVAIMISYPYWIDRLIV